MASKKQKSSRSNPEDVAETVTADEFLRRYAELCDECGYDLVPVIEPVPSPTSNPLLSIGLSVRARAQ